MTAHSRHEELSPAQIEEQTGITLRALENKLSSAVSDMQANRAKQHQVEAWYEQNLSKIVGEAITSGQVDFTPPKSEAATTAAKDETPDIRKLKEEFSRLVMAEPKIGFLNYFSRHTLRRDYLVLLSTTGTDITDHADRMKEDAQTSLQTSQSQLQETTTETIERYKLVIETAKSSDEDSFVSSVGALLGQPVLRESIADLLARPPLGIQSPVEEHFKKISGDPKKEGEFIGKLLGSFGDDFTAFMFAAKAKNGSQSEELKQRWQAYTDAFLGVLIPVGSTGIVNSLRYSRAAYEDYRYNDGDGWKTRKGLVFRDSRGNGPEFPLDKDQAKAVLAALAERPNYVAIGDEDVVNVVGYSRAAYEDYRYNDGDGWKTRKGLVFRDSQGNGSDFPLDKDQAKAVLAALAERPNYVAIGDKDVVNVMGYSRAAYEDYRYNDGDGWKTRKGLVFRDSQGNGSDFSMSEKQAKETLKACRRVGQKLNVMQHGAMAPESLAYGLRESMSWEASSAPLSGTDSTFDILPLIIIGAVILYSDGNTGTSCAPYIHQDAPACGPGAGSIMGPSPITTDIFQNSTNYLGIDTNSLLPNDTAFSLDVGTSSLSSAFLDAVSSVCGGGDTGTGLLSAVTDCGVSPSTPSFDGAAMGGFDGSSCGL